MKKYAILSMDVEDWYHLNYFKDKADTTYSMLDGFTNYIELLNSYNIKTTFFILSELADTIKEELLYAVSCGYEIACHGKTHTRPIDLSISDFTHELIESKAKLESIIGKEVVGYRAPCYGIDNERYEILERVGFKYSSSMMNVKGHPLYGTLDLSDLYQPVNGIYTNDKIVEFPLSTQSFLGKSIAISGGGWIRLMPWSIFMKPLIKKHLEDSQIYTLYIHPFELSKKPMPKVPGTGTLTNIRARKGLGEVENRIEQLIDMLKENGFEFSTFSQVYESIEKVYQYNC